MRGGGQAVRGGTLVIAGALLAGSVLRIVLPEGRAGMLGSRRRLADVAVLTVLGVGLLIAGLIVQIPGRPAASADPGWHNALNRAPQNPRSGFAMAMAPAR